MSEAAMHALAALVPQVGSTWEWEPLKDHARCTVVVRSTRWNGEEWWIESVDRNGGVACWNSLDRWVEATVLVDPAASGGTP